MRILLEAGELMSAGDYLRAQRARTLMRREWARMMTDIDVIAAPTVPLTAVPSGQETVTRPDGTVESVSDAYVRLAACRSAALPGPGRPGATARERR